MGLALLIQEFKLPTEPRTFCQEQGMHILKGFSIVTTTETKISDEGKEQKQSKFDNEERIENQVSRERDV